MCAKTTGPMDLMGLGATFDRAIANIWGQTEGTEGRELMVTGLFGPQTDLDRLPDWGRNLTTTGADPYLSAQMVAVADQRDPGRRAHVGDEALRGLQRRGPEHRQSEVQDQALHELYLTPYEAGFVNAQAAATMCSYQIWQDTATTLPAPEPTLANTYPMSPYGAGPSPQTWPLGEAHSGVRATADPDLRAARSVGVQGDGRLGLPGILQHLGGIRAGRGPGHQPGVKWLF